MVQTGENLAKLRKQIEHAVLDSSEGVISIDNVFYMDTATAGLYTLSLHDALPICAAAPSYSCALGPVIGVMNRPSRRVALGVDRKSTRLNSSHSSSSYAVFCLKKKKCPNAF